MEKLLKNKNKKTLSPLMEDEIYKRFIVWRSRPITINDPQNPEEFAAKYKTTLATLREFADRPEYGDDLLIATLNWAKARTPELIQTVYKEVKQSKDVGDLEKFLNIVYEIKKKDKTNNNQFNFFNQLTEQQYESILKREAKLLTTGGDK